MSDTYTRDRFAWLDAIATHPDIDAAAFRLAYVISGKINRQTGEAWPGIDHLAGAIGVNERTVRRLIDALVAHGFLTKKRGGDGRPNRYRMAFSDRTPMSDQMESRPDTHVHSEDEQTGHPCPSDRTFDDIQTGHPCPPIPLRNPLRDSSDKNISVKRGPELAYDKEFEELWNHYPRKVSKGHALKAFRVARKSADLATITAGVMRYSAERSGADPKFTKHFASWLNGQCWGDEALPPTSASPPSRQTGKDNARDVVHQLLSKGGAA